MLDFGQHEQLGFADPFALLRRCFAQMRFPERVTVSQSARLHRKLANPGAYSGPWGGGPYFVGHLDRPMDCLMSESPYRQVMVMGPSQVGKSEIGNNWQLHKVIYDPSDLQFAMPNEKNMGEYVKTQFDKMIEICPDMQKQMLSGASADTINLKRFLGCDQFFTWPTGPNFRSKPIPCHRGDDTDDFPVDIGKQGDLLSLMQGRMGSFAAYGRTMIYLNSTPKLGSSAPRGIEALVAAGTDERFWVDCLHCGRPFALYFDRLHYEKLGTSADAESSAEVACPHGCLHSQREKRPLLETFRWIGKGETAVERGADRSGKDGELLGNIRASFRFDGLFGFRPWSEIAGLAREAELAFETEQDEGPLKTFNQTIVGRNHITPRSGDAAVALSDLEKRAKASTYVMGEVPPGVLVLVASVDQHANRYEVSVWGFGVGFRAWLVDRFAVISIEENGRHRPVRPFTVPEDWAVLHEQVMSRAYPMAGAPHLMMKIFNTAVDIGGNDNATDNAFSWWHAMVAGDAMSKRPALPETAITLIKGGNRLNARLLPPPTVDAKRQIKGAPQAELFVPNVNRMKDILDARLCRREDGGGFISFPRDVSPAHLAELRAEVKVGEQWTRDSHTANETWDLYLYAYTVVVRFGGSDASLSWVPDWARPPKSAPKELAPPPAAPRDGEPDASPDSAPVHRVGTRLPQRPARRRGVRTVRAR